MIPGHGSRRRVSLFRMAIIITSLGPWVPGKTGQAGTLGAAPRGFDIAPRRDGFSWAKGSNPAYFAGGRRRNLAYRWIEGSVGGHGRG